jgi:hypothetical protein
MFLVLVTLPEVAAEEEIPLELLAALVAVVQLVGVELELLELQIPVLAVALAIPLLEPVVVQAALAS